MLRKNDPTRRSASDRKRIVVRPAVDSHDGMLGVVEGSNKWPVHRSTYVRPTKKSTPTISATTTTGTSANGQVEGVFAMNPIPRKKEASPKKTPGRF